MEGSPALLLLLALGLCCLGMRVQGYKMTVKFRDSSITHPRVGQRLELECETAKADSGAFWVRMDRAGTLHFIVFISSMARTTFKENERTSRHFEATRDSRFYRLVVKSFTPQDEGNYFCLMNSNQVLYFSPSQPAFLPVITTTPAAPTTPGGTTEVEPSPKTTDPDTSKKKEPDFFCDILIWVPLAGACLLLLLALAVTVVLCQRTRSRRCRCKRPVNGKPNVKPCVPRRHV